jgi:hypothetical protein
VVVVQVVEVPVSVEAVPCRPLLRRDTPVAVPVLDREWPVRPKVRVDEED